VKGGGGGAANNKAQGRGRPPALNGEEAARMGGVSGRQPLKRPRVLLQVHRPPPLAVMAGPLT
jgi:hypothetical protein